MIQNTNMSSQYGQQSTSPVMTIDSNDLLLSESFIDGRTSTVAIF